MTRAGAGGSQPAPQPYTIYWGAAVGDISENSRYVKSKVVALRREPLVETDLIGRNLPSVDVLPLSGTESRSLDSFRGSAVVFRTLPVDQYC